LILRPKGVDEKGLHGSSVYLLFSSREEIRDLVLGEGGRFLRLLCGGEGGKKDGKRFMN